MTERKRVGIVCTAAARERYFLPAAVERLERVATVDWLEFDGPSRTTGLPPDDAVSVLRLEAFVPNLDALVVSYGAPRVTDDILARAPRLVMVGDTHGDRFGGRIDVAAASRRGILAVDTTNGSSDPVAEWALALILIGLRNAGAHFRRLIAGDILWPDRDVFLSDPGYLNGELTGKTVGLIAAGNVGRRLIELLEPFHVNVLVHDPHAPIALADAYGFELASLPVVLAESDVVVCLVPLTSQTRGLLGENEFALLCDGSVFVNVSRGAVVDTDALIAALRGGRFIACLDVVEPEPLAVDSPLRGMPNVFLSPHIAGVTAAAEPRFFELMVDEVIRCLSGRLPHYPLIPREPAP
jgi:phosphoglycerate dehydrogenase-like enzyme